MENCKICMTSHIISHNIRTLALDEFSFASLVFAPLKMEICIQAPGSSEALLWNIKALWMVHPVVISKL